jgi:hypothetical protein
LARRSVILGNVKVSSSYQVDITRLTNLAPKEGGSQTFACGPTFKAITRWQWRRLAVIGDDDI